MLKDVEKNQNKNNDNDKILNMKKNILFFKVYKAISDSLENKKKYNELHC